MGDWNRTFASSVIALASTAPLMLLPPPTWTSAFGTIAHQEAVDSHPLGWITSERGRPSISSMVRKGTPSLFDGVDRHELRVIEGGHHTRLALEALAA